MDLGCILMEQRNTVQLKLELLRDCSGYRIHVCLITHLGTLMPTNVTENHKGLSLFLGTGAINRCMASCLSLRVE